MYDCLVQKQTESYTKNSFHSSYLRQRLTIYANSSSESKAIYNWHITLFKLYDYNKVLLNTIINETLCSFFLGGSTFSNFTNIDSRIDLCLFNWMIVLLISLWHYHINPKTIVLITDR